MDPRETLWSQAQRFVRRGLPVPIDLLAECEKYGLIVSDLAQPDLAIEEDNKGVPHGEEY